MDDVTSMAKVFTITEGLENMGALKTGGQGSVYKGRRIGEIITAVKLLPTPILHENEEDKHYRDFKNEVEKLKRVNERPNPHVVKILSAGITETGAFPFIEMEFIEGPDLEELLQPPHQPVFTLKEAVNLAEQLASALAHCHSAGVKHGDMKSNNVKLDTRTGNYVLLDFGLAAMSDEERRTSLRHAGAIEFMAPEQAEGAMLFQSDVYSFGIILYEMLAGRVPFLLNDKSETARNQVMLAHMEQTPPDLVALRQERLPADWSDEQKEVEIGIPEWLTALIYRCLQKDPNARFASGVELQQYIAEHTVASTSVAPDAAAEISALRQHNQELLHQRDRLQQKVVEQEKRLFALEEELRQASSHALQPDVGYAAAGTAMGPAPRARGSVSRSSFIIVLLAALGMAALAGYSLLKDDSNDTRIASDSMTVDTTYQTSTETTASARYPNREEDGSGDASTITTEPAEDTAEAARARELALANQPPQPVADTTATQAPKNEEATKPDETGAKEPEKKEGSVGKYKVVNKAYFHNEPDEGTRREAFIIHWNNAVLQPTEERNGFVYVVFTNHLGQTSRGWLRKSDLKAVED